MRTKKFSETFTAKILVFLKQTKILSRDKYASLRNDLCEKYYR